MSLLSENVRRVLSENVRSMCAGPLALDAAAMNGLADRRSKNESSSVRVAILAAASRVRCAALRESEWQSKASRKRKGKQVAGVNNCQRDKHCDDAGHGDRVVLASSRAVG